MNECTYLGRICTDLVLNKKAMDDKENYWTRFRLAVARKRVKKEGEKDTDFFNCVAFGTFTGCRFPSASLCHGSSLSKIVSPS